MKETLTVLLNWQKRLKLDKLPYWCTNLLDTIPMIQLATRQDKYKIKDDLRQLFIHGYIEIYRRPNSGEVPMLTLIRVYRKPKYSIVLEETRTLENLLALVPEDQSWYTYLDLPEDVVTDEAALSQLKYHYYDQPNSDVGEYKPRYTIVESNSGLTFSSLKSASLYSGITEYFIRKSLESTKRYKFTGADGQEYKFCYKGDNPYDYEWIDYVGSRLVREVISGKTFPNPTQASKYYGIATNDFKEVLDNSFAFNSKSRGLLLFCYDDEDPSEKIWEPRLNKTKYVNGLKEELREHYGTLTEAAELLGIPVNRLHKPCIRGIMIKDGRKNILFKI